MSQFDDYCARGRAHHGDKFGAGALSKKFIPYYNSGESIKVRTYMGIRCGTVGATTGWRPVFMIMARRTSTGSSYLVDDQSEILAVKRNGKYVPVAPFTEKEARLKPGIAR